MPADAEFVQTLQAAAARIAAAADLDAALALLPRALLDVIGGERAFVARYDARSGALRFHSGHDLDAATVGGDMFAGSLGAATWAIQHGAVTVTSNAEHDPRLSASGSIAGFALRSVAAAPLRVGDVIVGVVYADQRVRSGMYDAATRQRLTAFIAAVDEILARLGEA